MDGVQLSQGLEATEPLQGDSFPFTILSPEVPGTQLIDLIRMKG